MPLTTKAFAARMPFLDWTRGLAAVLMLQGHVFHSFTRGDLREGSHYVLSQFVGGMPPVIFLFLTGITLAFLMYSRERREDPPLERIKASLRRAGYLLMMAYLFRIQLALFGWGQSQWTDIFKVDILNCMGLSIAVMSLMAAFSAEDRARLSIVAGLAIAGLSPLVSDIDMSGWNPIVRAYIQPDARFFSFFPWASYLAFGLGAGTVLRLLPIERLHHSMQWFCLSGLSLVVCAHYFSNLPFSLYPNVNFWLNSPGLIFIRLGVTMLFVSFSYLWMEIYAGKSWSWVRQLGTTSMLVYWVHIELVYGRWFGGWKDNLSVPQAALMAASLIGLMVIVSLGQTKWKAFSAEFAKRAENAPG